MKFGLFHSIQWPQDSAQQDRYAQAIREAIFAEDRGFESIWLTEHHFTEHGIVSDSLAVLAYLAGRTTTVRLGTAVSVLPFHDPVRLADILGATVVRSVEQQQDLLDTLHLKKRIAKLIDLMVDVLATTGEIPPTAQAN